MFGLVSPDNRALSMFCDVAFRRFPIRTVRDIWRLPRLAAIGRTRLNFKIQPALALNIRRLGKVPDVWNLIVGTKRANYAQMHDLTRINVRNELTIDVPFDFEVPLDLVDENLKGYAWHLSHPQPGYAK